MANDDFLMSQDQIEQLFGQTKGAAAPAKASPSVSARAGGKHDQPMVRSELEKLLGETGRRVTTDARPVISLPRSAATAPSAATPPPPKTPAPAPPAAEADLAAQDIEYLLTQAEQALESVGAARLDETPAGVSPYQLPEFSPAAPVMETATLDLVRDVELDLKIELGRTHMYLEDVLKLRKGSVVPLDKLAGDPVDIHVNGRLIARGEILVLNDNFCVRVAELVVGANAIS